MGKKRIVKTDKASETDVAVATDDAVKEQKLSKKHIDSGVLYVESTYNNTKVTLTDNKYNTLAWSSSGALGFKGAKKGTPFAAAKVGETLALKAQTLGVKEVKVVVKGVGSGRESAIRGFISKGINLTTIQDKTSVPHNGPKPPRPRRN
ncbi:MAG: Ribosomal protein S11 [Parcubacteria group bacterium GW2011_GWB1_38_8]|nr:MAG: Ribosomal protein S11 [Parcubacteria group bacterium GW2011_GWB1_38_8]KKR31022.1 MAG: Ribosomal protein S11 [Parcubacteria group bacterium GW2011_GWC1_39_8]